jgi:Xaa-Pro dipeptidase
MVGFQVDYRQRQARLNNVINNHEQLDAMAFNAGPSLYYLMGLEFHLSERPVVGLFVPETTPVIILPELEAGKLDNLPYPVQRFTYGEDPDAWESTFRAGLGASLLSEKRVGIEPRQFRVLEMNLLESGSASTKYLPGEGVMAELRMIKDESELANMRAAVIVAQNALKDIIPAIKPGLSERELAAEITTGLLRGGSESHLPFAPIVASGPNSANPHSFPGERRMENGDMLILDWGGTVGGYFSDLTRTFTIGEPEDEMKRIAQIVLEANSAARDVAGPGVQAQAVDRAARKVIEDAGYGEYFIHRTGHGLGLEGHEAPYIRDGNVLELEPGMTFTIEPGIYLPGRGGVRIEDDVVITADGLESFSDLPRELKILGDS